MEQTSTVVKEFIDRTCSTLNVSMDQLLRFSFGIGGISDELVEHTGLLDSASPYTCKLIDLLDLELRLRNPTLTYAVRANYFSYRRPNRAGVQGPLPPGPSSSRSDAFISVRPRKAELSLVLPLDPAAHDDNPQVSDLSNVGHHGPGDLEYRVSKESDIHEFIEEFATWLTMDLGPVGS